MNNYNDFNTSNFNINQANNINNIDLNNLNGTNIMDLNKENFNNLPQNIPLQNFNFPVMNHDNPINNMNMTPTINSAIRDEQLIKSIAREIQNNLKENNISLHDDITQMSNNHNNYEDLNDYKEDENEDKTKKMKSQYKPQYKKELKKKIEHIMTENGVPNSESVSSYIFDDLFNYKEFIILFSVYFLLSQELVKDLFAQYFTSLNPDETGKIHVKGVIIYGLILTILYLVIKKIV
jgi:hypothetical protein